MALFSRKPDDGPIDPSWPRCIALVIAADAPPQNAPSHGPSSRGTIQVLADVPGAGRQRLSAEFRYADTRWVVPGMDVPIAVDPARPGLFVVDWSAVPAMPQLVAANHPALADPFAASRRIAAALGVTPSVKTAARLERFQQAVTAAATQPAAPGRVRAVAMTVTVRGRYDNGENADGSSSSGVGLTSASAAVLSVAVAGRAPYAVYVPKFKFRAKHLALPGEPMPALVSTSDPQDVEIRWDEMPGMGDQIAARMADSARANSQLVATMTEQYQAALANPQPVTGMPPQARQLMIDNLRRSLMYVRDPAQRQMMLNQYRAMGLDISPEELGL